MTKKELIKKMTAQVKKTMTHYQEDFYKYDLESLEEFDTKEDAGFVWIVRELGTHFLSVSKDGIWAKDIYQSIVDTWGIENMKVFAIFYTNFTGWEMKRYKNGIIL